MKQWVRWDAEVGGYAGTVISEEEFTAATSALSPFIHITGFTYGAWAPPSSGFSKSLITGATGPTTAPFYGERRDYSGSGTYANAVLFASDSSTLATAFADGTSIYSELDASVLYGTDYSSGANQFVVTSAEGGVVSLNREASYDFGLTSLKLFSAAPGPYAYVLRQPIRRSTEPGLEASFEPDGFGSGLLKAASIDTSNPDEFIIFRINASEEPQILSGDLGLDGVVFSAMYYDAPGPQLWYGSVSVPRENLTSDNYLVEIGVVEAIPTGYVPAPDYPLEDLAKLQIGAENGDGYIQGTFRYHYSPDGDALSPTFVLRISGGEPPEPPPAFWTGFVNAREEP